MSRTVRPRWEAKFFQSALVLTRALSIKRAMVWIKSHPVCLLPASFQQFTLAESCSQYERVLRSVVEHELINDSEFRGHLPETATLMMRQLAVHRGLRPVAVDICTWSVLGRWALHKRTLDFTLFVSLVARIRRAFSVPGGEVVDPLLDQMFWSAADAVVHSSVAAVRHSQLSANPSQHNALFE